MKSRIENVSIVAFLGITVFLFVQFLLYTINFFTNSLGALNFG